MNVHFHCSGENKDGVHTVLEYTFENNSNDRPVITKEFLDFCKQCKDEEFIHLGGGLRHSVEYINNEVLLILSIYERYDRMESIKRKWGRFHKRVFTWIQNWFNKK